MPACPVDCACHTNPTTPCDHPGGCGTAGCGRVGTCPACRKRDPETGLVCEPCRRWMPTALASIPTLAAEARTELLPDDDSTSRRVLVCTTCGHTVPWTADRRYARHPQPEHDNPASDKVHAGWSERRHITHTGGPAPSIAPDIIIASGATEAPVPLNLHVHDLLADVVRDGGRPIDATGDNWIQAIHTSAKQVRVDNGAKGFTTVTVLDRTPARDPNGHKVMTPAGDQIGAVPIAQILDQEVRAWIDAGAPGARWRPAPTIPNLVDWLAKRLNWACDHYPAMDAFADMLSDIRSQLRNAVGDTEPEAELCEGVACNRCDLRMLYRRQDGTGDVECQNPDCFKVLTKEEYRDLVRYQGRLEREEREPAEVAELLRR